MQSDLFNLSLSNSFERQAFQKSFFEKKYSLRTDQLIGVALTLIVFFVLVFAWGVERGKSIAKNDLLRSGLLQMNVSASTPAIESAPQIEVATRASGPLVEVATSDVAVVQGEAVVASVQADVAPTVSTGIPSGAKYTIAHMTYVRKEQAKKEIERIKSKGQEAFIVPSGKYFQICVAGYLTRPEANEGMKLLRSGSIVSSDAYIRNMPAK